MSSVKEVLGNLGLLDYFAEKRTCKKCGAELPYPAFRNNNMVCPSCGAYQRMNAEERISLVVDKDTFIETNAKYVSNLDI